mmetsp:Transcript_113296/g.158894  ORF Transcript_113296/g.158894 Transcript_113296/m.158894 type:complete len:111 (-) Transcript_113296:63-395(-)
MSSVTGTPAGGANPSPRGINFWNEKTDKVLLYLVKTFKNDWDTIALKFNAPGLTGKIVKHRFAFIMQNRHKIKAKLEMRSKMGGVPVANTPGGASVSEVANDLESQADGT